MRTREALIAAGTAINIEGTIGSFAAGISITPILDAVKFDPTKEVTIISNGNTTADKFTNSGPKYIYSTRNKNLCDNFILYNDINGTQNAKNISADKDFALLYDSVIHSKSGITEFVLDGEERIIAYNTVPDLGWKIFTDISKSQSLLPIYDTLQNLILISSISIITLIISMVLILRHRIQPITILSQQIKRISDGHIDTKISTIK